MTKDWNAWFDRLRNRLAREDAEKLREAKEAAHADGKEPFDLERFETIWPDNPLSLHARTHLWPRERRLQRWEHSYYLVWPKLRTVEEFAAHIEAGELEGWFD